MERHIVTMVRNRALRYGTREVLRYKDAGGSYKSYNWQELVQLSNRVAKSLLTLGYGSKSNIGIFSDNKPEWTLADLGILATRAVTVPFFGTASKQQVKYIVNETRMELMFVGNQEQLDKALWLFDHTESLTKVISFDPGFNLANDTRCMGWHQFLGLADNGISDAELEKLLEQAEPDELATIIYTSGTTGEPKGVMIGQDNFMTAMLIHDDRLDVTDQDVSLCFLPLSHIYERTWTYYILHCGAVNVYLENPRKVIDELPLVNPTLMCTVPRFFEKTYEGILAEEAKWSSIKRKVFDKAIEIGYMHSEYRKNAAKVPLLLKLKHTIAEKVVLKKLRLVFGRNIRVMPCSGSAIRTELLRFFHATGLFVNYGYGASETTATVSCFKSDVYEFGSCGTVMPGITVKINEQGEILVKGNTIFKGYYNKPLETAKVLNDGWYSTGDQGDFTVNGNLVMKDRINDIFKTSGGKYVSPQKVELLLCNDPFIEQAIVVGDNRKYIAALIVPSFIALKAEMLKTGAKITNEASMIADPAVIEFFQNRLDLIQEELTSYEKAVKFTLLPEPFSIENEALTSTLKIKRKVILSRYAELIEKMY